MQIELYWTEDATAVTWVTPSSTLTTETLSESPSRSLELDLNRALLDGRVAAPTDLGHASANLAMETRQRLLPGSLIQTARNILLKP